MKNLLLSLLLMASFGANCQIAMDNLSVFTNYNGVRIPNGFNDTYRDGIKWNLGGELQINDYWSVVLYHEQDYDGYNALGVNVWGAPLPYYDASIPWATRYTESFGMVRLYTESNYYNKSVDLRSKDLYGFYFALGYAVQTTKARYWAGEQFTRPVEVDGEIEYIVDTYIDRSEVFILDRSMQFGCGFKNFHSRMIYSDIMLLSSAYNRDHRYVTSEIFLDPRRADNGDPSPLNQEFAEELTNVWAKNGRGILVLVSIGINLDIH